MKRVSTLLVIIFFLNLLLNAQTIENIRPQQNGDKIDIYYEIANSTKDQLLRVIISAKVNDDKIIPLRNATGDIGDNVVGGKTSYKAEWDVLKDLDVSLKNVEFYISMAVMSDASKTSPLVQNMTPTPKVEINYVRGALNLAIGDFASKSNTNSEAGFANYGYYFDVGSYGFKKGTEQQKVKVGSEIALGFQYNSLNKFNLARVTKLPISAYNDFSSYYFAALMGGVVVRIGEEDYSIDLKARLAGKAGFFIQNSKTYTGNKDAITTWLPVGIYPSFGINLRYRSLILFWQYDPAKFNCFDFEAKKAKYKMGGQTMSFGIGLHY